MFKFICCGNVDDGKSTLIGRILFNTGNVKKDQLEDAKKASLKNGSQQLELSMLLDGLLSEREQQITIDVAHRYFDYQDIRFHIFDCPGHQQYIKNMAIAAAEVDTAIVVIDALKGIQEQTKKHIEICSLFHLKRICVCLNKYDILGTQRDKKIRQLKLEVQHLMASYSFEYKIIPISALSGYNVDKVLKQLCSYASKSFKDNQRIKDSIIHIQAAKLYQGKRYYYGRIVNDVTPKINEQFTVWPKNIPITITNMPTHGCFQIKENVDISAGDCIANCSVNISNIIHHKTIWFEDPTPNMLLKHGTRVVHVIHYTDDTLELDNPLIFNNIEDVKQNSFGIFIDETFKKTLGCCVFEGNNKSPNNDDKSQIYIISADSKEKLNLEVKKFIKLLNRYSILLDVNELSKIFGTKKDILKITYRLSHMLTKQGHNVIIAVLNKEIKNSPLKFVHNTIIRSNTIDKGVKDHE